MVIGKIPMKAFMYAFTFGSEGPREEQFQTEALYLALRSRSQEALLSFVVCTLILCAYAPTTDMYTLH